MPPPYEHFQQLCRDAADIQGLIALADWDQETMMPSAALEGRARQRSWLAQTHHEMSTGPVMENALSACIDLSTDRLLTELEGRQVQNVRVAAHEFQRQKKVPGSWVKQLAATTPFALDAWARAKQENDFQVFAPWLERIVELNRERSRYLSKGGPIPAHPYDPLLDLFEPGCTLASLHRLYGELQPALVEMRETALRAPPPPMPDLWKVSADQEMQFCRHLIQKLGLTKDHARLDLSHHPFCTSCGPGDVRLTTRLVEPRLWSAIMSTMHEAGHGLYDHGLNPAEWGLPGGSYCSLGIHESQSRLWECRVGHSYPFLEWLVSEAHSMWPNLKVDLPGLYRWLNRVRRDPIRVESDEVSYTLHIILRTHIEAELVAGELRVKDVPARWNALSHDLLGLHPAQDAEGCLQDIHWAHGEMGYFPSYCLGNVYSAQLFEAYRSAHPGWESECRSGQFESLRKWLHTHIWSFGKLLKPAELIERATGYPPLARPYLEALRSRLQTLGYT
jgi:carboxypeptidase Taq